jgi:hypothetical protein
MNLTRVGMRAGGFHQWQGRMMMTTTRTDENAPYYYFTESLPQPHESDTGRNQMRTPRGNATSVCDERQPP